MALRAPAQIRIGGSLAASSVPAFYRAACEDGVGYEWAETRVGALEEFTARLTGESPIELCSNEAPHGELKNLEAFCRENRLTYVRECQSEWDEEDEETHWWTPGMGEPGFSVGRQGTQPWVAPEDLRSALRGSRSFRAKVAAVEALLMRACPPELPPIVVSTGNHPCLGED
jgi:hypothetical protein